MNEKNKNRKNKIRTLLCLEIIIAIVVIILVFYLGYSNSKYGTEIKPEYEIVKIILRILYIIWGILGLLLLVNKIEEAQSQRDSHKRKVKKLLDQTFANVKYQPDKGIPISLLKATRMIKIGKNYWSNDLVSGEYKDIEFIQGDIALSKGPGGKEATIFQGRWLTFEFPKKFTRRMEIVEKGFKANIVPAPEGKTRKS